MGVGLHALGSLPEAGRGVRGGRRDAGADCCSALSVGATGACAPRPAQRGGAPPRRLKRAKRSTALDAGAWLKEAAGGLPPPRGWGPPPTRSALCQFNPSPLAPARRETPCAPARAGVTDAPEPCSCRPPPWPPAPLLNGRGKRRRRVAQETHRERREVGEAASGLSTTRVARPRAQESRRRPPRAGPSSSSPLLLATVYDRTSPVAAPFSDLTEPLFAGHPLAGVGA